MEAPVAGSDVLREKMIPNISQTVKNLEYVYSKDGLAGEVDVSPTKSVGPSTRRKRRHGPIFLDKDEARDLDEDESGSDVDRNSMLIGNDEEEMIILRCALRENFQSYESAFKTQYSYGAYGSSDSPTTFMLDVRHCITSLTRKAFAFPEETSGIMWVGVRTADDICVATLREHVDRKRLLRCLPNLSPRMVLSIFRQCVLSELEDLADPSSKLCEKLQWSIDDVPFCVVSATTPVDPQAFDESGHETSSDAYDVPEAVSFIQGSGLLEQAKDRFGVIKLAISAFQRLMGKKFEAKDIEVTVVSGLRNGYPSTREYDFPEIIQYAQECSASLQESL